MAASTAEPGSARRTAGLFAVFVTAKIVLILLRAGDGMGASLWSIYTPFAFLYQDVIVCVGWLALDLGLGLTRLRTRVVDWLLWIVYAAIALLSAVGVPVARVFSTPLTWQIVAAAGGALSDSIHAYVTARNVFATLSVIAVAVLVPFALRRIGARRRLGVTGALALLFAGSLMVTLGPTSRARIDCVGLHRNAVWALVESLLPARGTDPDPARPLATLPPEGTATDLSFLAGKAAGRNVVWIILESTGATSLAPYGAPRDATPNLTALARESIVFEHAYAAYPESIKGLFASLCSTAPAARTPAEDYTAERLPLPCIATRLKEAGYRTALFHSGHFVYLGMRGIVEKRGFDTLVDAMQVGGRYMSSFGVDEASTVARALSWIDETDKGKGQHDKPFFLLYSPIAGHHPYNAPGPDADPRPFPVHSDFDAYSNDLFRGDRAVGALLDGLHARGLDESTIVIVNGDHGEAFQQHEGNFAHTLFVYEENVRVPLLVRAAGLTNRPIRAPQIASTIDLAPTMLDLLGIPATPAWQGRSLLRAGPGGGVARFFSDQVVWQLGLRSGHWKLIFEMDSGRSKLFDLDTDPGEHKDIAPEQPERASRYRNDLIDWAARQKQLITHPPH